MAGVALNYVYTLLTSMHQSCSCCCQGYNARPQNVALVVNAFRDGLQQQGKL
jgi:hypothetical protein